MGLDSELQPLGRGAPAAQRAAQHEAVLARLQALLAGEDDFVAMMATVACELHHAFDYFDWTVSPFGWRWRMTVHNRFHLVLLTDRQGGYR